MGTSTTYTPKQSFVKQISPLYHYEHHRLLTSKSVYICAGAILICQMLSVLLQKMLIWLQEFVSEIPITLMMPSSIDITLSGVIDGSYNIMLGIIMAIWICSDYANKTARTLISSGFSKPQIYFVKWDVSGIIVIVTWALSVLFGALCGLIFSDGWEMDLIILRLFVQFMTMIAYASIFTFVGTAVKKTSTALIINLIITLAGSFIASALSMVATYGNLEHPEFILAWFPDTVLMLLKDDTQGVGTLLFALGMMLAWTVLMFWLGLRKAKKNEV